MSYAKSATLVAFACLFSCLPKVGNQFAASDTTGSSSSEAGADEPGACGDTQPTPGVYCFVYHNLASIVGPSLVVGAPFTGAPPERFAVFSFGGKAAMVSWDGDHLTADAGLPPVSPASYVRVMAANIQGEAEPEIVLSQIWAADFAPNKGGILSGFMPIGLPDSAFTEPGHTIPLDLGNDGTVEFLKGSGASVSIWRNKLDVWSSEPTDFLVPGCKTLVDFAYGDFNGDGLTDLAYIGNADTDSAPEKCKDPFVHGIVVLLQNELGGLALMPMISTDLHKMSMVQVADFDADGLSDVSALAANDDLLLFRSKGNGQFIPPVVVHDTLRYVVGDLDGDDGAECIIFTRQKRETIVVDDVFGEIKSTTLPGISGLPLAVSDLNQDGVGDVAFMVGGVDEDPTLTVAISNP